MKMKICNGVYSCYNRKELRGKEDEGLNWSNYTGKSDGGRYRERKDCKEEVHREKD